MIGAGGQKIQELRDRFNGVQVMFRSPGEKSDVVTIRGPKDDVEKCAKHLRKLVDDLVSLKVYYFITFLVLIVVLLIKHVLCVYFERLIFGVY